MAKELSLSNYLPIAYGYQDYMKFCQPNREFKLLSAFLFLAMKLYTMGTS